ncbi:hypothetical protein Pst134EB_012532 [Puccinia striiformis f. sp. tritici]|nr:hypothetical protein Pst134EB_012532 [Puccinia striiformis f. sp. tritici]
MYLGLDAWQSPNGFDILGTVLYRLVKEDGGHFHLEAMPLDFVKLQQSHTGLYLAENVQLIVEKFGLKDKICGIVTDNASNNQTMIDQIKTYRWPRFKGETQWVRCFAHILNLMAQVILRPFGSHKRKKDTSTNDKDVESDEDEPKDPDGQIRLVSAEYEEDEDDDDDDNGLINNELMLAAQLVEEDKVELEDDDVKELSDEDEDDRYTSQSCKTTLAKFCAISRKLNKSPNSKALFVDICRDIKCPRPHNVGRDVCTWWNSTLAQLSSIVRCLQAIVEWQKDKRHGPSREYHINSDDINLACDLVEVLQPFYEIMLQISIRGGARIADIVVFIDQITSHLSTAISNKRDEYPPALRNACRAGLQLTNKYYTLTDYPPLYQVAMVLHPVFKDEYFKLAKWKPEGIDESIRLTRDMWETHYKPLPQPASSQPPVPRPKEFLLGWLARPKHVEGAPPTDPLTVWLAGGLSLNEDGGPVNPLKWWMRQQHAGNTDGGLLQMALDVLSCPATTVDVERSFSFGRDYVSLQRHRLSASSVTRGMSVAFYGKNGKIKKGVLHKWKLNKENEAKQKGKGKAGKN